MARNILRQKLGEILKGITKPKISKALKNYRIIDDQEIERLAREEKLEDIEKALGIGPDDISMAGLRYPISKYYKISSEKKIKARHQAVEKFFSKLPLYNN